MNPAPDSYTIPNEKEAGGEKAEAEAVAQEGKDSTKTAAAVPAGQVQTPASALKPKPSLTTTETGMSATSGPMGDHMAEVWRDSDVGSSNREEGGTVEGVEGEGGKF